MTIVKPKLALGFVLLSAGLVFGGAQPASAATTRTATACAPTNLRICVRPAQTQCVPTIFRICVRPVLTNVVVLNPVFPRY